MRRADVLSKKKTQGGFWDLTHKSNNDCPLTSQVKSNMIENQSDTSLSSQTTLHVVLTFVSSESTLIYLRNLGLKMHRLYMHSVSWIQVHASLSVMKVTDLVCGFAYVRG